MARKEAIMSKKVILIQDDIACNEIMRYILEEEGFEVITPEPNQVLNNISRNYDLAIIDEYSEGRTGSNICKQLKTDNQTWDKPVILTSTGINLESLARACHADKYLGKPFDINCFSSLIKSF